MSFHNYNFLDWHCECGHRATQVRIGLSSNSALVALWKCQRCEKQMMDMILLENLLEKVPPPKRQRRTKKVFFIERAT